MMKIKALNEASTNDVDDSFNNIISTEAQEQIVMNEYNKALKLLVDKNFKDALSTFQDLVNTELLEKVLKPLFYEGACRPMLSLKYSCYKNIANIYNKLEEYPNALCHYWEASKLDDTDVTLWYKIGQTACRMFDLELSCFAFAQGLKCNTNHWPCLDKIITILFAIPDYISCLFYIFLALKKDPSYYKGLIFYQKIMSDSSFYGRCYIHYNNIKSLELSVCDQFNFHLRDTLMDEVDNIHKQWLKKFNKSGNFKIDPIRVKSMKEYSWVELGKTLLDTYNNMVDKNRNLNYSVQFQFLSLDSHFPLITTTSHDEVNQNVGKLQESEVDVFSPNSVGLKFEDCDLSHSTTNSQEMRFSVDVIHSNRKKFRSIPDNNSSLRKIQTSDSVCYTKENATDRKESEKDKANKGKKRRRSSLCFLTQWAWSGSAKRSSRIRTPIKKDYESDGAILEETLREIFPPDLL
ncbi:calcineurin-binding protein cabin-1 [Copidosoma floridanum]|uniref:calcineurin-binding protein cabin-1 n=1 Tax=Copidosoma floridanum TaxID=29053 RepID=UPI000C6F9224|nr:calcineurin-binding protein cabin-1 [Copidosoma floridanum]